MTIYSCLLILLHSRAALPNLNLARGLAVSANRFSLALAALFNRLVSTD
jgi:hypothetical protein